jgi:hypothetical protein
MALFRQEKRHLAALEKAAPQEKMLITRAACRASMSRHAARVMLYSE